MLVNTWAQSIMKGIKDVPVHSWSQINISLHEGSYSTYGYITPQDLKECPICKDTLR